MTLGISQVAAATLTGSLLADLLHVWETLGGTPDDALLAFTISDIPVAGSIVVFRNEAALESGGVDYTQVGVDITFVIPPATGDRLRAIYIKF